MGTPRWHDVIAHDDRCGAASATHIVDLAQCDLPLKPLSEKQSVYNLHPNDLGYHPSLMQE
jgi:hypothetical protein